MLVQSLVVLAAVTLTPVANPIPQRPELAPPPREKAPAPWDRRDLLVPGDDFPREARKLVYAFLEYAHIKPYQPEVILEKICLAGWSVKRSDIDLIRDAERIPFGGQIQLVTENGKEAVMMFGSTIPDGDKKVSGHLAITVVQVDEYTWRVKGIHFAEGDTVKRMQKLIDEFYDAHPGYRPKRK